MPPRRRPLGATVYARPQALSRSGTPVIKLPTSALRQEGKGSAVWVLDKATMTVRSQPVQVATADGNEAVIGSGLTPGMLVVVGRRARAVAGPEGDDLPGEDGGARRGCAVQEAVQRAGPGHPGPPPAEDGAMTSETTVAEPARPASTSRSGRWTIRRSRAT